MIARILGKIDKYNIILSIICMFNATAFSYFLYELGIISYLIISVVCFIEILILFRAPVVALLTVACAMIMHLFTFRAIVVSIFSYMYTIPPSEVISTTNLFIITFIISVLAHMVSLILFMIFIKPKDLMIIAENVELLAFVAPVAVLLNLCLIFNGDILNVDYYISEINLQQFILPTTLLLLFYITLFMTLRFIQLHGYKEKSIELEGQIEKHDVIRDALFSIADIFLEVNCTEDRINRYLVNKVEVELGLSHGYSDFLKTNVLNVLHPEDKQIIDFFSINNIIANYNNNVTQLVFEYRSLMPIVSKIEKTLSYRPDEYHWFKLTINTQQNNTTDNIVSTFTIDNITTQKIEELELRKRTETDSLTGGLNRMGISSQITKHLISGRPGALFMFDLDNFKGINDNMGHAYGDKVLCEAYDNVVKLFRAGDLVSRIGGDEFNIFLPNLTSLDKIKEKAELICKTIEKTYHAENGVDIKLSSSIGVSRAPDDANTYLELIKFADIAMYDSKHRGKNTYTIYDATIHTTFKARSEEEYQRKPVTK